MSDITPLIQTGCSALLSASDPDSAASIVQQYPALRVVASVVRGRDRAISALTSDAVEVPLEIGADKFEMLERAFGRAGLEAAFVS